MTPEQMQKIVDNAPEWASIYSISDNCYYEDYAMYHDDILISHLRAELAKHDSLRLEAIICDGDKISDEARELIKDGFIGSIPTIKTVLNGLNKEYSIQVLDLEPSDIPHGTIVLER